MFIKFMKMDGFSATLEVINEIQGKIIKAKSQTT
jgi:hypothetical protein